MRLLVVAAMAAGAFALVGAPAAQAGEDIPWTWNSEDHDVEARFASFGEWLYAKEYNDPGYVDWYHGDSGSHRWWVPGDGNGNRQENNLSLSEGKTFAMKVCQHHTAWPDDCSGWKYGVS